MKPIAIYCVNYHSYDSLEKYLQSIFAVIIEERGIMVKTWYQLSCNL